MKIDLQKILCALGFHDYEKWGKQYSFGYDDYQRRTCKKCGYETTRKIGWIKENSPSNHSNYSYSYKCSGECENCNLNGVCGFSKKD